MMVAHAGSVEGENRQRRRAGEGGAVHRGKIAFVKLGDFSHVNREIALVLSRHFPEYELEILDVQDDLSVRDREIGNVLVAFMEYGTDVLLGRKKLRPCLLRTTRYFKRVKAALSGRLVPGEYAFSFQTQSLFDASREGVPHCVYTDHTHLALLDYPDFDRKRHLFSDAWIALEKSIYSNAEIVFTTSSFASRSLEHPFRGDRLGKKGRSRSRGGFPNRPEISS
jgi:hypothetical protein